MLFRARSAPRLAGILASVAAWDLGDALRGLGDACRGRGCERLDRVETWDGLLPERTTNDAPSVATLCVAGRAAPLLLSTYAQGTVTAEPTSDRATRALAFPIETRVSSSARRIAILGPPHAFRDDEPMLFIPRGASPSVDAARRVSASSATSVSTVLVSGRQLLRQVSIL